MRRAKPAQTDAVTHAERLRPRSFGELREGALGALVLHGFTGAPHDVVPVAEALHQAGFSARVPVLRGHDAGVAGIRGATLAGLREDVDAGIDAIVAATGRPALVAGLSMGALLGVDAALRRPDDVAGVASLAAPLAFGDLARGLARAAARSTRRWLSELAWPKIGGSDISNGLPVGGADAIPFRALAEIVTLARAVRDDAAHVGRPLVVVHAREDHTAPLWSAYELARTQVAPYVRLVVLTEGYHVITRDVCAERVATEVVDLARRLA